MSAFTILICFLIMLILDLVWINTMMPMYSSMFNGVQDDVMTVKFGGAFVAYCLMFVSLWLVVFPSIARDTTTHNPFMLAVKHAGLVGLIIYGIYNATNYATLKRYSSSVSFIDTIWGITVYTMSVFLTLLLEKAKST